MLTLNVEHNIKLQTRRSSRLMSTDRNTKPDPILERIPKMKFKRAVEKVQSVLPIPNKHDLTQLDEKGNPERLKYPYNNYKEMLFILKCIDLLEPAFHTITSEIRSRLHSTESSGNEVELITLIKETLEQLANVGQDFKTLAVIVKAAKKNFATIDSLSFDKFGASLNNIEWVSLCATNKSIRDNTRELKEEMAEESFSLEKSPKQRQEVIEKYQKIVRGRSTPLYEISSLNLSDCPEPLLRKFAIDTFKITDKSEKSRLRSSLLSQIKFLLLVEYRNSGNDANFKLKVSLEDLDEILVFEELSID